MLLNGPMTNDLIGDQSPVIARLMALEGDARTQALFLRVVGRAPSKGERRALRRAAGGNTAMLQDVFWALLNSSEFLYNH